MKVVIAGGTGLIGKELKINLLQDGHQITVLSRSPRRYRAMFSENVTIAYWDGQGMGEWVALIDGADAVVNLAGESIAGVGFLPDRWSAEEKQRVRQSRIAAGKALVMAVEAAGDKPHTFIQASAVGYYGATGDTLVTESSPLGDDFLASVTRVWEASTEPLEALGVRRVVARIGLVLSTEEGALPRLLLPSRLLAGGWFGSGDQYWPWIHIADVAGALSFLLEDDGAQGTVNVTAPDPVTNKEFGRALGRALKRPSVVPVPAFALRLALGEVASTVLEGQRAIPQRLLQKGFTFRFPDIDSALHDLLQQNQVGQENGLIMA